MASISMSRVLVAVVLCFATVTSAFDPHEPSGEVVHLTDENFDELTDSTLPWFVAVTAPWWAPACT